MDIQNISAAWCEGPGADARAGGEHRRPQWAPKLAGVAGGLEKPQQRHGALPAAAASTETARFAWPTAYKGLRMTTFGSF